MKTIIAIIASLAVFAGAAYAGCGKNVTAKGKAKFNKETKILTVDPKPAKAKKPLKVSAKTKVTGKDGKVAKLEDLLGGDAPVYVVFEHADVKLISATKPKEEKKEKK